MRLANFSMLELPGFSLWPVLKYSDPDVQSYVTGLGNWITGNYESWGFENSRYKLGSVAREMGRVELFQKSAY